MQHLPKCNPQNTGFFSKLSFKRAFSRLKKDTLKRAISGEKGLDELFTIENIKNHNIFLKTQFVYCLYTI